MIKKFELSRIYRNKYNTDVDWRSGIFSLEKPTHLRVRLSPIYRPERTTIAGMSLEEYKFYDIQLSDLVNWTDVTELYA